MGTVHVGIGYLHVGFGFSMSKPTDRVGMG